MPMYEYECSACNHKMELLRPMKDADAAVECEKCHSRKVKRAHSVFAAATGGAGSSPAPMAGCGRCGDPRGSCSLN